jgi:hypothetical protein
MNEPEDGLFATTRPPIYMACIDFGNGVQCRFTPQEEGSGAQKKNGKSH